MLRFSWRIKREVDLYFGFSFLKTRPLFGINLDLSLIPTGGLATMLAPKIGPWSLGPRPNFRDVVQGSVTKTQPPDRSEITRLLASLDGIDYDAIVTEVSLVTTRPISSR